MKRMLKIKKDTAFGIIPICFNDKNPLFLVVQHQAGHWGFPKGHVEKNENSLDTARREFEEEVGITDYDIISEVPFVENYIISKEISTFHKKKGEEVEKTVSYFPAIIKNREVALQKTELQNFQWLPFEEAFETLTFKESKEILTKVYQSDFLAGDNASKFFPK